MDLEDLRHSLDYGNTFADAANFLCRDEDEVRQKSRALGAPVPRVCELLRRARGGRTQTSRI
jgi:hypothetical protein